MAFRKLKCLHSDYAPIIGESIISRYTSNNYRHSSRSSLNIKAISELSESDGIVLAVVITK